MRKLNAIKLAIIFHEYYERLAPDYGYETKKDTQVFNAASPNGKLMIATCRKVIAWIYRQELLANKDGEHEQDKD